MANAQPIGVFDSGVGGLAVAAEIRKLLPAENLLYYADHAHFPYGSKDPQDVRARSATVAGTLIDQGAKAVVVACNTASSLALADLRARYNVPFVGIVPAVKPAALTTRTGKVGVLATAATFRTRVFADLVEQFARGVELVNQACPDLVAAVESGETDAVWLPERVRTHLEPMLTEGIDTLVLGCTHYSFLREQIEAVAGPDITVIDAARPVAKQLQRVLEQSGLLNPASGTGTITYMSSSDLEEIRAVLEHLLPSGQYVSS